MGLRDRINQNPRTTLVVASVFVTAALVLAAMHVWAGRRGIVTELPDGFFTIDDGKTYFTANLSNVAPFDYQGKPAVRAYVFQCKGKPPFVGYLERYTPEGRKAMLEKKGSPGVQLTMREVKAPGAGTWINVSDSVRAGKIIDVRCSDGSDPEPIAP
jgi:hypothetical protein